MRNSIPHTFWNKTRQNATTALFIEMWLRSCFISCLPFLKKRKHASFPISHHKSFLIPFSAIPPSVAMLSRSATEKGIFSTLVPLTKYDHFSPFHFGFLEVATNSPRTVTSVQNNNAELTSPALNDFIANNVGERKCDARPDVKNILVTGGAGFM